MQINIYAHTYEYTRHTDLHIHVVSPTPSQGPSWRRHPEKVYVLFKIELLGFLQSPGKMV